MNMKFFLESKFQNNAVTIVEYYLREEDLQIANIEDTVDQTLEDIEKYLEHIPKFPEEDHKYKGKQNISEFEMAMCSKFPNVEELEEQEKNAPRLSIEILAHQTTMETLSEVEAIKKSLQYYKAQNG